MSDIKSSEIERLKAHLAITPKTANMLHTAGYTTPQSLAQSTPNEIAAKFASLPGMDKKKAYPYIRPLRRMVMLGTVEDAEQAAVLAQKWQTWTMKHLTELGIWEDGFDDLTGEEIRKKVDSVSS